MMADALVCFLSFVGLLAIFASLEGLVYGVKWLVRRHDSAAGMHAKEE